MRVLVVALPLVLISASAIGIAQSKPPAAVAQGPRAFELSELSVTPGAGPTEKVVRFSIAAKPEAPTENIHLLYVIRESGGTPFGLLRLDAADLAECASREVPGQIDGWTAVEVCRVKKPPVLIGWRGRAVAPAAQLSGGKIEIRLDNLPPEGWLEIGLSQGAADPAKDPRDRVLSNAVLFKLDAPK
jgi:hypothetical protein